MISPIKASYYRKALWGYILLIFILAVIAINSTVFPLNNTFILSFRLDYLSHFAIFIPLMWLIWNAYNVSFCRNAFKALIWVLVGLSIAGLSEGLQYFIPYRSYNINDLVANVVGVLLGSLFFIIPSNRFRIDILTPQSKS